MISEDRLVVSSSPHIRGRESIQDTMLDVILALMPAAFAAVYYFGTRALAVILASVGCCVGFEFLWQVLTRRKVTVRDLSAVVTGMLLAYCLPVTIPFWMVAVGAFAAIIVTKQFFGGLGQNFMNPALIGRAFMLAAFPLQMTTWAAGRVGLKMGEVVTSATPLADKDPGNLSSLWHLFLGVTDKGAAIGGSLGETCALALVLGGLYLLARRIINWRIPVTYLATVALMSAVFTGKNAAYAHNPLAAALSGGVMLGAIFMATDYTTSPTTGWGQIIMGVGCGFMTAVIRLWGGYPEGVTYAILLMNALTPLLDRWTKPRIFGRRGAR